MGVWGLDPFSNDTAADWSWRFNAGAFDDPRPVDLDTGVKLLSEALSCSATDDYGLLCAYAAVAVLTALATAHSWYENADFVSHFTPLGFYLDAIALVAPPAPSR